MDQKLDELAQYIVRILPQRKSISNLREDAKAGIVRFTWHAHHFAVKPSLEVLELKGANLFITGASILMQSALSTCHKNSKVLGGMDDTLRQVEDFFSNHPPDRGLELFASVNQSYVSQDGRQNSDSPLMPFWAESVTIALAVLLTDSIDKSAARHQA